MGIFIVYIVMGLGLVIWSMITKNKEPKKSGFTAGDKVTAFGNTGTVKRISPNGLFVEVTFPEFDSIVTFHLDGKFSQWHKKPSLRKL